MVIEKPRLWKYKTGAKAGQLRPKAKQYLSEVAKQRYAERRDIGRSVVTEIKKNYKRYSVMFADVKDGYVTTIRGEIINPENRSTAIRDLQYALEQYLIEQRGGGKLQGRWFVRMEGYEIEDIDEVEALQYPINEVIITYGT